ncbi:MAG: VWA domain-containing protein [Treponema sp.]|jgi:hypothetical protein|nr:VWA domain-containing protein [Treponema sp.]
MKKVFFSLFAFCLSCVVFSQTADLGIGPEDLRLVPEYTNDSMIETTATINSIQGYHLFVRKKPDIASVLLTETTRDSAEGEANYAFRALVWNGINGDEIRRLNGEVLTSEYARFSIIDSTVEPDGQFGSAFHLFIPREMAFGYPWTRNGVVQIGQGTFINIRTFGALYGDYTNGFQDNPFMFDFVVSAEPPQNPVPEQQTEPVLTDTYNPSATAAFAEIAGFNKGTVVYSRGPYRLAEDIIQAFDKIENKNQVDVVLAIDATGSMKDAFARLRLDLLPRLKKELESFGAVRIGLLVYRDYADNFRFEGFPVNIFPFTTDLEELQRNLESIYIIGSEGGDIPEAVYEALYVSIDHFHWNSLAEQKIILIGDAEPHPKPRGARKYSKELIQQLTRSRNITIDTIVLPDGKGVNIQ